MAAVLRTFEAVRGAGKPVGVNAFDPAVADRYLDAGASFVLVGADVALLARGSEALAARFIGDAATARARPTDPLRARSPASRDHPLPHVQRVTRERG